MMMMMMVVVVMIITWIKLSRLQPASLRASLEDPSTQAVHMFMQARALMARCRWPLTQGKEYYRNKLSSL